MVDNKEQSIESAKKVIPKLNQTLLQKPVTLTSLEKKLVNYLQTDMPLCERPFVEIAKVVDSTETQVINCLQSLINRGVVTRFGPLFDISRARGAFSLCALKVPSDRIEQVTEIVNSYQSVAHNYLREHEFNMWFVLAAKSEELVKQEFDRIVSASECQGINCPKEREFFVGLNLVV